MVTITIDCISRRGNQSFSEEINKLVEKVENEITMFGYNVAATMRTTIAASTKRKPSSGNLAKNITAEKTQTGIGIGSILKLDSNAPYWKIVNDGGVIPPKTWGYFPGYTGPVTGHTGDERWTTTGSMKDWYIDPQKPITPMYYIEQTVNWIDMRLPILLNIILD